MNEQAYFRVEGLHKNFGGLTAVNMEDPTGHVWPGELQVLLTLRSTNHCITIGQVMTSVQAAEA